MTFNLNGKLSLITGAAGAIGSATARQFASNGSDLILADVSPDLPRLAQQLQLAHPQRRISAHVVDVSSSSGVERLFDEIKHLHDTCPTVLVNAVGKGRRKSILDLNVFEFDEMIDVNLKVGANWFYFPRLIR